MSKRLLLFAALLLLCVLLSALWWKKAVPQPRMASLTVPKPSEAASMQVPTNPPQQSTAASVRHAQPVPLPKPPPTAGQNPPPPPTPQQPSDVAIELDAVQLAIRDFRTVLGANPVGTNAEITRAMLGDNLKQVKIPIPQGSQLNAKGELSDRWGTPYFFHQVSHDIMEIRSAGPDRIMWTDDDLELK